MKVYSMSILCILVATALLSHTTYAAGRDEEKKNNAKKAAPAAEEEMKTGAIAPVERKHLGEAAVAQQAYTASAVGRKAAFGQSKDEPMVFGEAEEDMQQRKGRRRRWRKECFLECIVDKKLGCSVNLKNRNSAWKEFRQCRRDCRKNRGLKVSSKSIDLDNDSDDSDEDDDEEKRGSRNKRGYGHGQGHGRSASSGRGHDDREFKIEDIPMTQVEPVLKQLDKKQVVHTDVYNGAIAPVAEANEQFVAAAEKEAVPINFNFARAKKVATIPAVSSEADNKAEK